MPYKTKAELERKDWMTLLEVVAHICSTDKCDERIARRELIAVLADNWRVLGPLRWERDRDDRPPPFGATAIIAPTDAPPLGAAWSKAKINWKTGRVQNDWGEYKPGKWRLLLISRHHVARHWPPPSGIDPTPTHGNADLSNVVSISARKRGRKPGVANKIKDLMLKDLSEGKLTRQELDDMEEEAMAARYGASRDTCRKVRSAVLWESKIVENSPDGILDK
jgi:hypothetical protein